MSQLSLSPDLSFAGAASSDTAPVLNALASTGSDLPVGLLTAFAIVVLLLGAALFLLSKKRRGIRRG